MVEYLSPVLPHVHLRGNENGGEKYLELGYRDAKAVGAVAVLEMPNTNPALINDFNISSRMQLADKYRGGIKHGIHIGLTNSSSQISSAFEMANVGMGGLTSVKAYWVHSTGDMGILDDDVRKIIWRIAADMNFKGAFIQHCEDERLFEVDFDCKNPVTHSLRQNPGAETVQVMRQLRNARDAGFKGKFYVAHVSSADTIDFLKLRKKSVSFS